MKDALDAVARAAHAVHGTRGLTLAAGLLLLLAMVEPAFPAGLPRSLYAVPLGVLLVVGLATLPREGVAARQRALWLVDDPDARKRMVRRAAWGAGLCVALLPNLFLAVQGIPHMSPLAGLALPGMVRRIALVGLFAVLLLAVLYLRSSRSYAPHIGPQRPRDLRRDPALGRQRDVLLVSQWVLVVAWAWALHAFWQPFSLLQWHAVDAGAYLSSFQAGARSVAGLAFVVVPPAVLFMALSAHLGLLNELQRRGLLARRRGVAMLAVLHAAFCVTAAVLHAHNLFWLVRYRSMGFL